MGRAFWFLFVVLIFFFVGQPLIAQAPRYTSCDLCGYCPPPFPTPATDPPQSWTKCVACIYPGLPAGTDATNRQTLLIDPSSGAPPTPAPGFQYTGIGCLSTDAANFSRPGAIGGVVQTILNIIFRVVGGIAFLYLIYGAFVIITSQSNPERLDYGKRLIFGDIIGLVFKISSVLIIRIVVSGILKIPQF